MLLIYAMLGILVISIIGLIVGKFLRKKVFFIVSALLMIGLLIFNVIFIAYAIDKNEKEYQSHFPSQIHNNDTQEKGRDMTSAYNNPIVPKGFKKVETDSASWKLENGIPKGWNNGLVIEDEIGNQFVWIPNVEVTNENLIKIYNYDMQDAEQKAEQLKKYNEQIEKYGGFYIARYEAGISEEMQNKIKEFSANTNDIQGIPVSKKGQIVWNYISLKNAKKNAQSMYNNETVESDLITPLHWMTTMQWVYNGGYDITDAKEWGNFSNVNFRFTGCYSIDHGKTYTYRENKLKSQYNMILSTGATERNKSNNIYDLAGNVMEYTDGWVRDRGYYSVGGHYDNVGNCIYNLSLIGVVPLEKLGYRIVLYNE